MGLTAVVGACTDSRDALAPTARPASASAPVTGPGPAARVALDCVATLGVAPAVSCVPAKSGSGTRGRSMARDVILGRQNIDVTLAFSNYSYAPKAGTTKATFGLDVTLHNLLNQPLGTTDGTTATAANTRIFVYSGPSVTTGHGTVSVFNPDGFSTFTQSNQPYFQYPSPIQPGATTAAKTWKIQLDTTVHGFSFSVEIDGALPAEKSIRRWTVLRQGITPDSLTGVWQHTATDVYAVGMGGSLLNYNGSSWSAINFGSASANYRAVSGLTSGSSATIFAVGDAGTIARDSAGSWSSITSNTAANLYGVWPASAGQTFAVGAAGTIVRSALGFWVTLPVPAGLSARTLRGIWGADASHIWVVGDSGTILFSNNGITWSTQTSNTSVALNAVWGTSASNVYAVGAQGTILHFDGASWSAQTSGSTASLASVGGLSATDLWAVGAAGTTLHSNGTSWSVVGPHSGIPLSAVAAGSATPWAVGAEGSLLSFDGTRWQVSLQSGLTFNSVWASSATDVWVATLGTVLHYDGSTWTNAYASPGDSMTAIWGLGAQPNPLLTAGTTYGAQYVSGSWLGSTLTNSFTGVWGSGGTWYAVARGGTVATWVSGSPTYQQITNSDLNAVWGVTTGGSTTVFAAASNDSVYVKKGGNWSEAHGPGVGQQLLGVFGSSGSDVYAVGTAGTVGHYTSPSTGWVTQTSGTSATLRGGWATAPQGTYTADAYAVGDAGTVLHYNGTAWLTMPTPVATTLRSAYGTSATNLYVTGDNGVVLLGSQ